MPTRIVLRDTGPSAVENGNANRIGSLDQNDPTDEYLCAGSPDEFQTARDIHRVGNGNNESSFRTPPRNKRNGNSNGNGNSNSTNRRPKLSNTPVPAGFGGFRSSIFQETAIPEVQQKKASRQLSRSDIRASPRLHGYLFNFTASMVMLVSVIQFYTNRELDQDIRRARKLDDAIRPSIFGEGIFDEFTTTFGTAVLTWKLYGAVALSAAGASISLFIMLAHFDTLCFPQFWKKMFRDGSKAERNLLWSLLVFWALGIYICTSTFSVGEVQINVYFTTWICFFSTALNASVWREGADLPAIEDLIYGHKRETTHNWVWFFGFALVTSLSILELYSNRGELTLFYNGDIQPVPRQEWVKSLIITWSTVGISAVSLFCNHIFADPTKQGMSCISSNWRWVEGFFIALLVGIYTWIIIQYTGVNGVINGPSNSYFGIWGCFFCSVFTFGTWLKENKTSMLRSVVRY